MKLGWEDVGFTETEGEFNTRFGLVTVMDREIAVWKNEPEALFLLVPYSTINPPKRGFILGSYEAPD